MTETKVAELREAFRKAFGAAKVLNEKKSADGTWENQADANAFIAAATDTEAKKTAMDEAIAEFEAEHKFGALSDWVDADANPANNVPRGMEFDVASGNPEGRKALLRTGWELKQGVWSAPTLSNQHQVMYHDDVLFGDMDKMSLNANDREFMTQTRASFQPLYRPAYTKFMQAGMKGRSAAAGLTILTPEEQKVLSEGVDADGGYIVPVDMQTEIMQRLSAPKTFRSLVTTVNTTRDRIEWPRVQAADSSAGPLGANGNIIFSSGFIGEYVGEFPSQTDADFKFGKFVVDLKKVRVRTRLGNDFISDAMNNVLAFVASNGADNMAGVMEYGVVAGKGTEFEPTGLVTAAGISTDDVEGTTGDTISNTTSAAGSAPKLVAMTFNLPEQYLPNAQWLGKRATEGKIRGLVDGNGRFMWGTGGFGGNPNELEGYAFNRSVNMPAEGTSLNKVLAFGDFSHYIEVMRAQISTKILNELYAESDQTGIILFARHGGDVANPDAIRFGLV